MTENKPKFLRRTWSRYSKLGKRRKKKQKWRRPTGRDNKMREKRRGYASRVSIGYGSDRKSRKEIIIINNLKDLEKAKKGKVIIIGSVGKKKKMEIAKAAKKEKIKISNMNPESFLKKNEKQKKSEKKDSKENKKPEKKR